MRTAELAALPEETLREPAPAPPPLPITAALVALGGGLGALVRYLISLARPDVLTSTVVTIPWTTLAVNVAGCVLLGALNAVLEERPYAPTWVRPLLGVGFLGGFTTFSTLILQGAIMMGANSPAMAFAYALVTTAGAIGGALAGLMLTRTGMRRIPRLRQRIRQRRRSPSTASTASATEEKTREKRGEKQP